MTGAGSATDFAFVKEDSFNTLPGTPSYYEPGQDPTIQDLTLQRALNRQREPGNVWSSQSVAENLEGAFAVQYTMDDSRQGDVHDIVFNGSSPVTLTSGLASTSRWYTGLEYHSNGTVSTAERELKACAPVDYSVEYTQGGEIRVTITFIHADEDTNTTVTPASVNEANGNTGQFHGADFTIDGTTQAREQSATLSISNISRFQRGSSYTAVEAVTGAATATLDINAIITETDQLELGYGGSGQTSTSKTMSGVSGSMALSAAGSQIVDYQFGSLKPDTYSWQDLINDGSDTTEQITFHVNGDPAVTVA